MYLWTCRREWYSCFSLNPCFAGKRQISINTHRPDPSFADALLVVALKLVQLVRSELHLQCLEYQLLFTGTGHLVFCLVENLSQSENLNLIFKSSSSSTTDSGLWSIHFFPMLPATHQMFKALTAGNPRIFLQVCSVQIWSSGKC